MRGHSKNPPRYRKHRKSGQAIVTLSGVDFYLGPHGTKTSKLEYDRLIGEWLANGRRLPDENTSISISRLIADYWSFCGTYYRKNGKPTGELASIKVALRDTKKLYSKQLVSEFGPLALDAIRELMIARDNSRGYINKNINRIRRMFKWGVARQIVPVTVYQSLLSLDGLKMGKSKARETDPVMPVDDAIVDATLKFCNKRVADMIQIQRLTGCRPGEVRTMRPSEIDRTHDVWRYSPGTHKMEHKGRGRVILLGPKAQAILLPYLQRDETKCCFEKPRGGMFARWNYNEKIKQACNKAFPAPKGMNGKKLKQFRKANQWAPNRLRHSCATEIRRQFGLEASQAVLGHASADVTQIYAERDIDMAAKIMAVVG